MDQFRAEQVRSWIRRLSTYGITTRYIFATAGVGIATVVQLIVTPLPGGYAFILYYPAVTISALLLDRGAGFYAAILSAFLGVHPATLRKYTVARCTPFRYSGEIGE